MRNKNKLNSQKDNLDKLIKEACEKVVEQEYESRPKEFPKHQFSAEFERNMEELMRTGMLPEKGTEEERVERKPDRGFSLPEFLRPMRMRRVAVVVAVAMAFLVGTTASGMNPIVVWLYDSWVQQHGDYVELENREKGQKLFKEKSHKYELTKAPEGYEIIEERFDEKFNMYVITYANEKGKIFDFSQGKKDNGNLGNITANRKDIEEIEIGNLEGYYFKDSDAENLVLSDEEYMLVFAGNLSKEEFIELAGSLHIIK